MIETIQWIFGVQVQANHNWPIASRVVSSITTLAMAGGTLLFRSFGESRTDILRREAFCICVVDWQRRALIVGKQS